MHERALMLRLTAHKNARRLITRERWRWIISGQHQMLNQAFYFESPLWFRLLA
jgi:hypothetical protein